jgi:excisionase family DNA binding protein
MSDITISTQNGHGFAKIAEVAMYLNISRAMAHKMVKDGRIPSQKIGKVYRIPWSWLRDFSDINK